MYTEQEKTIDAVIIPVVVFLGAVFWTIHTYSLWLIQTIFESETSKFQQNRNVNFKCIFVVYSTSTRREQK